MVAPSSERVRIPAVVERQPGIVSGFGSKIERCAVHILRGPVDDVGQGVDAAVLDGHLRPGREVSQRTAGSQLEAVVVS
jgi:hypothetical protein